MAGIPGQPQPKASSLNKPVPGSDAQAEADAFLSAFKAPQAPAASPDQASQAQGTTDPQAEAAAFLGGDSAPEVQGPSADQFAPEPGFVEANTPGKDAIGNFITRFQAGLAANDKEKIGFLQNKYGKENVALKDNKIYWRKDPGEKLKPLDPATFELINDIIPDFAREAVTEASMVPGEVAGALAFGGAATLPTVGTGTLPAAAAGAAMGRIASVPMANANADALASLAGVPQDPERNVGTENLVGQAAETVLPVVGGAVARSVARRIPGTAAYKAAREAGEKEVVALTHQTNEVLQAADSLKQEGISLGLTIDQINPLDPKIKNLAGDAAGKAGFINKQVEFAEGYGEALKNTLGEITRRANPNGKSGDLPKLISGGVEAIEQAEGKVIGEYKAKALAATGNARQPLPEALNNRVNQMLSDYGFTLKNVDGKISISPPKDLRALQGNKGLTKIGDVRSVVNVLGEVAKIQQEGARLTDLERIVNLVGDLNPKLRGSKAGAEWGGLTGELRSLRREAIGNTISDPAERALFNRRMDEFSTLKGSVEQLSNVLRDDVSAKTIVGGFFKGKENIANIRALKQIAGADSPEWGGLKEEFVNQLLLKHSNEGLTGVNSKAMLNDLEKNYGADFIKEVLNDGKAGPNYDTVKNLLTVGQRIESTLKGAKADNMAEQQKKGLADTFIGFAAGIKFKMINGATALIGAGGERENPLMEMFNRDGYERYLAQYRGVGAKDKGAIARNIEAMLSTYNAKRAGSRALDNTMKAADEVVTRAAKGVTRESAMRGVR